MPYKPGFHNTATEISKKFQTRIKCFFVQQRIPLGIFPNIETIRLGRILIQDLKISLAEICLASIVLKDFDHVFRRDRLAGYQPAVLLIQA